MAANDSEFIGPARERNRDFARGWNGTPGTLPRGGITWPEEVKIRKGTVLIRIGHSRDDRGNPIPDWVNLTSPWWMESGTFLEIAARGEDAGTGIEQMVRMKLALTPDFGVADTLFWVITRDRLRAWNGRARPVMEDPDPKVREKQGRPMAWLGGYEVAQNFIPGLRDFAKWCPTQLALDAFGVLPKMPIGAYATIRKGGFGLVKWPWPG
ncbi:hypothetical protein [Falsiroseomonas sp. CW058]|uniref:hypothetical protein n=1 Tax=Falsiroseomonas sp. CW058 TaxID=3388664 RepID=UPI003D31A2B8